jgi:uncharacterized membrane protein YtjA (UPF0391 family)
LLEFERFEAHAARKPGSVRELLITDSRGGSVHVIYYALIFLLIAVIAGFLGFWAVAGIAAVVAKVLFFIFMAVFLVSLVRHLARRT